MGSKPSEQITIENRPVGSINLAYQVLTPVVYTTWIRVLLGNEQFRKDCIEVFGNGLETLEVPYLEASGDVRNLGMSTTLVNLANLPPSRIEDNCVTQNIMGNQFLESINDLVKQILPKVVMIVDFSAGPLYEKRVRCGENILIIGLRSPTTSFIMSLAEALISQSVLKIIVLNTTGEFIPPLPNDVYVPKYLDKLKVAETWLLQNNLHDVYFFGYVHVSNFRFLLLLLLISGREAF